MNKTIGILGGMGPLATCDLFRKIIRVTEAERDQQHVRVCIDSNTEIPDRTDAILYGGKDPLPEMLRSAKYLQETGADVLIMPCNTAHFFYRELAARVEVPVLNMIQETADVAAGRGIKRVGLLATDGTIRSGVYHRVFSEKGIEELLPDEAGQRQVMRLVYDGVKAGRCEYDTAGFRRTAEALLSKGAEVLVLGCTELPVALRMYGIDLPHIDPTLVLASRAVQFVGAPVKTELKF